MSQLKLSPSTPVQIQNEVNRLIKYLPAQEVDNFLTLIIPNNKYNLNFYLQLYQNIQEWGVQAFFWRKKILTYPASQENISQRYQVNSSNSQPQKIAQYKKSCILRTIQHIKFINLKVLFISSSDIKSIQPLSWINMEKIHSFILAQNHINSLKPLAKCSFKYLQTINVTCNKFPINQLNHLSRTKMKKIPQKSGCLWVFSGNQSYDKCINLAPLLKCQIQRLKDIFTIDKKNFNKKLFQNLKKNFFFKNYLQSD